MGTPCHSQPWVKCFGILSLNGVVSGSGSIVANDPGTLFLAGNNTYSGGTAINGGIVQPQTNAAALVTAAVTVNAGGSLRSKGNVSFGGLSFSPATGLPNNNALPDVSDSNGAQFNGTGRLRLVPSGGTSTVFNVAKTPASDNCLARWKSKLRREVSGFTPACCA